MSVLVVAEHLARPAARRHARAGHRCAGARRAGHGGGRSPRAGRGRCAAIAEGVDEIVQVRVEADEFESDVYQAARRGADRASGSRMSCCWGFTVNAMGFAAGGGRQARARLRQRRPWARSRTATVVATRSFYGGKVHAEARVPRQGARCCCCSARRPGRPREPAGGADASRELQVAGRHRRARHLEFVEVPQATSTSPPPTSCSRSAAASGTRTSDPAVRAARREAGRRALGVAPARRRGLDAERAPGRPVGQDGQAEGLPRAGHLRRRAAPRRHEDERDDHRRQHRPGGGDLRRRPLRGRGGPVRRRGGAREALDARGDRDAPDVRGSRPLGDRLLVLPDRRLDRGLRLGRRCGSCSSYRRARGGLAGPDRPVPRVWRTRGSCSRTLDRRRDGVAGLGARG